MSLTSLYIREQDGLLTLSTPDDELADEVKVDWETTADWQLTFQAFARVQREMQEALNA